MGADLLLARLAAKRDKAARLDWEAGRRALREMNDDLFSSVYDEAFGESPENREEANADVQRVFDELYDIVEEWTMRRDVDVWDVGDLVLYVTGGMSWGDSPTEAFDVMIKAAYFPEVLAAIGFETGPLSDQEGD